MTSTLYEIKNKGYHIKIGRGLTMTNWLVISILRTKIYLKIFYYANLMVYKILHSNKQKNIIVYDHRINFIQHE